MEHCGDEGRRPAALEARSGSISLLRSAHLRRLDQIIADAKAQPVEPRVPSDPQWTKETIGHCAYRYLIGAWQGLIADVLFPCDAMQAKQVGDKNRTPDFWEGFDQKRKRAEQIGYPRGPWNSKGEMTLKYDPREPWTFKRFELLKGG